MLPPTAHMSTMDDRRNDCANAAIAAVNISLLLLHGKLCMPFAALQEFAWLGPSMGFATLSRSAFQRFGLDVVEAKLLQKA